jgi:NAD(P)-dependent dehydrogenase (short-subunit alcohol dehydrogenase family)
MEGKVIAITGGASGIALATAKILASRGAKISIADISEQNLEKAKESIKEASPKSEEVLTTKADVRNIGEIESWIKKTVEKFGKLDGAANLAGIPGNMTGSFNLANEDEDNWDRVIGINLTVRLRTCVLAIVLNIADSLVVGCDALDEG